MDVSEGNDKAAEEEDEEEEDSMVVDGEEGEAYSLGALKKAFSGMDQERQGGLSPTQFMQAMEELGEGGVTLAEAEALVAEVDSDGDGRLGFNEFVYLITRGGGGGGGGGQRGGPLERAVDAARSQILLSSPVSSSPRAAAAKKKKKATTPSTSSTASRCSAPCSWMHRGGPLAQLQVNTSPS
jgi:hypothetical protein